MFARRPIFAAQLQRHAAAALSRTGDDARRGDGRRRARDRHIAELLVFPRKLRVLGQPMQARTGDALGEMTPVRRHKRAGVSVRTRRDQMRAGFDQLSPRGDDALPAGRRARLDDDERCPRPMRRCAQASPRSNKPARISRRRPRSISAPVPALRSGLRPIAGQIFADALLIEASAVFRTCGEELAREASLPHISWRTADIATDAIDCTPRDLVTLAYALNELAPEVRQTVLQRLWRASRTAR
jgi:Mitochondrial small ribosomal subunit Rsm22